MLTGTDAGQASLCTGTQLTMYFVMFWPEILTDLPHLNILYLEHASFTLVQMSNTAGEEWHHK